VTLLLPTLAKMTAATDRRSLDGIWTAIAIDQLELRKMAAARPWVRADRFATFALEPAALEVALAAAPMEFTVQGEEIPAIITLPRPDGALERFAVVESPVMHPDLERRMAELGWPMKTFSGISLDRPGNTARLDWGGPAGFHAMVHSPDGSYFVDPYWQGDVRHYSSYFRRDYTGQGVEEPFRCEVHPAQAAADTTASAAITAVPDTKSNNTGGVLRT